MDILKRTRTKHRQAPHAVLVTLLFALLILPGCQMIKDVTITIGGAATPALPHGWTWYHDDQFPFDAPIPPGWQAHGYWYWVTRDKELCIRRVDLVPPVSQPGYASNPERLPEYVKIQVANTCPVIFNPDDPLAHWWKPTGTTPVGGAAASTYAITDEAGVQQLATTRFGGRQYVFYFNYEYGQGLPQSRASTEIALYQTILKDFVYHGQ